jgi:20S proteasome alpha/beta subunit
VTLCIAVKCREFLYGPRVVCCFDAQVGNDYESSESEYKFTELSKDVSAMYSGPLVAAKDLLTSYEQKLARAKFTVSNYRDVLWKPMQVFADANAKRASYQQEDADVKLLLIAVVEGGFRLLTVDSNGIREHSYHAAIGTGEDSATAMLRWRKPTDTTDLQAAIYFAYEAKRIGEVSPHVGKHTFINVLCPKHGLRRPIEEKEIEEVKEAFNRFGPQPFDWKWKLSSSPWPQLS